MQESEADKERRTVWMENTAFLYDRLMVHKLKWPSLTFQWLPFKKQTPQSTMYHCLYATHSTKQAPTEHIYIAEVIFPKLRPFSAEVTEVQPSMINTVTRFTHQLEINKARGAPDDPAILAARTDEGPISLFKYGQQFPVHLMEGNLNGGFALEWSQAGILSGDFAGNAFYWQDPEQAPITFNYGSEIEDIKIVEPGLTGMVGDNGMLAMWDMRSGRIVEGVEVSDGQQRDVYCLSVNPQQRNILVTGGQDQMIKIWDRRNLKLHLHKFQGHEDSVMSLDWSQTNHSVFASGSADKRVKVWDMMRVGFQIPKDLGGTDQLLFTHEGHQGAVNQVNWHPSEQILGSVGEGNTLQFYQMTNNIHELEYAQDLDYLRQQCLA